jgi:hypothetical protein
MVAAGLIAAGIPEDFEGPTLIVVGPAHGLDLTNAAAAALVLAGALWLLWGAARHASDVLHSTRQHLFATLLLAVQLAAGVALLLLSGVSTTLIWWATGTFLSVTALLGLSAVLKQGIP